MKQSIIVMYVVYVGSSKQTTFFHNQYHVHAVVDNNLVFLMSLKPVFYIHSITKDERYKQTEKAIEKQKERL